MKKIFFALMMLLVPLFTNSTGTKVLEGEQYVVLGWNDLGMHCANKDFSSICVLPPYNNVMAQVIKKGDAGSMPQLVTTDIEITYEIPGNTYSVGKTNFWDYEDKLFGVTLSDNIGLKGNGLSGKMQAKDGYFIAEGIPITPYTDADLTKEDPYQLSLLKVYDKTNNLLATTRNVVPVSNEIGCVSSGCHSSEANILNSHEQEGGFNPNNKPILCAKCHASNALGTTGISEARSLSERIHSKHASRTNDCYKCHPGQNTKCLRDVMFSHGKTCQDCHGSVANVGSSIRQGRKPWLEEPSCNNTGCHDADHAPESGKLYRQSKGHGGLYCSACHGSPHAIQPTIEDRDNQQNINLQGYEGVLSKCAVCHGTAPSGPGPHGLMASVIEVNSTNLPYSSGLLPNYPNPFTASTDIIFRNGSSGKVTIDIFSIRGERICTPVNEYLSAGEFKVKIGDEALSAGTYYVVMKVNGQKFTRTIIKI